MFDEKHEIGGAVLFVSAFAVLAFDLGLDDTYTAALIVLGLAVWLGPKMTNRFKTTFTDYLR